MLSISESRLNSGILTTTNIQLPGFNSEHMPTTSPNYGALLYIKNDIYYKLIKPELRMKKKEEELESIFIEFIEKYSKNIIIGWSYRHPFMYSKEFDDLLLKPLTEQLTKEDNRDEILLGDFNIDLMQKNSKANALEFLDIICSGKYVPHSTSPSRLTSRNHAFIDNIYSNINEECISGNVINAISINL